MSRQSDGKSDSDLEDRRRMSLIAFLGVGIKPPPSTALLVSKLADARRAVAELQSRGEPLDGWLASEIRFRGIRENAAVLAAMEISDERDRIAREYREHHPDRAKVVDDILACL